MRRGTTPQLTFTLPEAISITALYITFKQGDTVAFEKTLDDVSVDGKVITLTLTQEDTLRLNAPHAVQIQLRLKDTAGNALASEIIRTDAETILKEGVI